MVNAIVLINVRRDCVDETAETLSRLNGVAEIYSVAGEYDLVAIIRTNTNEQLAKLVTKHMLKVEGIVRTNTLVAFRAYSRYDLERLFSIGFEETP
ncbi:MAG: Lrp/AsnC ligand binding domain-containing protein [Planctomycetes bacterium]|nr:Lrp/AsnC ligand binding domain-containing protein [Planctomycetota bacterium]